MQRSDVIRIDKDQDGIATIWLDHQLEKMNVVSPELITIFNEVFEDLYNDSSVKAVVLISAKKDFIAGADIKSFSIEKKGDFRPFQEMGHQALDQMEKSPKPVVAAIHGTCFGLGTEIILACTARIASDDPSTKFALPEVKLGLIPGGGGTQRLPKVVGLQKSLEMATTGKNIFARQAKTMGLVDELTNKAKLEQAAKIMAKNLLKKPIERKQKKTWLNWFLDDTSIGRNIVFGQAKKMAAKQTQGNYPAVDAIIDCIETGLKQGNAAGYAKELDYFEELMLGDVSAALRSLFFAMTENKKNPYEDQAGEYKELKTLGMLGAGFMGAGITEVSVINGIDVLLKDLKEEMISEAKKQIYKSVSKKVSRRSISRTDGEEIMNRIQGRLDYADFDQADIVIEAVLEKMDLKKTIISQIEDECRDDVVIATNTSSLSVTEMAEHAKKPEMVIGMHYFSPVPKMPLLEIVKTKYTKPEVIAACYDFGIKQGKTVVVVQDGPGFYVNRILAPYLNECLLLLNEGAAIEEVDRQLKKRGFPVGPISLFDEVGLDIAAHVAETGNEELVGQREGFEVSDAVVRMYKDGRMGRKNKQGFFQYDAKTGKKGKADPAAYKYFNGNGDKQMDPALVQDRPLYLMLNEAVWCYEEDIIANPTDGDLGAVFGIGFLPYTGGPFRYMDQLGIDNVVKRLEELKAQFGPKYTPRPMLVEMAKAGRKFHNSVAETAAV